MSSESAARKTFRKHVLARWPGTHWQRVEDLLSVGVPDINCCIPGLGEWWIEAKELDAYPKRATTPVRIGLTTEQALWLETRRSAGGNAAVMVRVPEGWAWFRHPFAHLVAGLPQKEFRAASTLFTRDCAEFVSMAFDPPF